MPLSPKLDPWKVIARCVKRYLLKGGSQVSHLIQPNYSEVRSVSNIAVNKVHQASYSIQLNYSEVCETSQLTRFRFHVQFKRLSWVRRTGGEKEEKLEGHCIVNRNIPNWLSTERSKKLTNTKLYSGKNCTFGKSWKILDKLLEIKLSWECIFKFEEKQDEENWRKYFPRNALKLCGSNAAYGFST